MAVKFLNRVRMSVSGTPGTGTLTLATQAVGFQAFDAAGMSDGDQTPYLIEDGSPNGAVWELGIGTWHSNNTFVRDTVTQSSAGGTSKITATSGAIISAIFRAADLTGIDTLAALTDTNIVSPVDGQLLVYDIASGMWRNETLVLPGSTVPSLVQFGTVQRTASGAASVTLGSAPTQHNLLVAIGSGGGSSFSGVYSTGFDFALEDVAINSQQGTGSQYQPFAALRTVRAGESSTLQIGNVGSSGFEFNGVLAEIAGVDISRFSQLMWKTGSFASIDTLVAPLATMHDLTLMFYAGASGALTISNPATVAYNNDDGTSRLAFTYNTALGDFNGISGSTTSANGVMVVSFQGV